MSLPTIVSREEWLKARKDLLAKEKAMTRARDALSAERRELPMVEITKPYVFHGPDGELGLLDMFEGRHQLILGHFMFNPEWEDGCPSCTAGVDEISSGLIEHLHTRDTSLAHVSRAPLEKLERYKRKKGWDIAWYSSYGSDFNYDFNVTVDESVKPAEYNYKTKAEHEQDGDRLLLRRRAADRAAGDELLRARRRPRLPHLFHLRARRGDARRLLLLARPHRPGTPGGVGGAEGPVDPGAPASPDFAS